MEMSYIAPLMKYANVKTLLIDFDSVICEVESMDVLFSEALANSPDDEREGILLEIKRITDLGMSGEIPFAESLSKRLALLPPRPAPLLRAVAKIKERLSPSFLSNLPYLLKRDCHILSSGFRQLIEPALAETGFPVENIHCNDIELDSSGVISGVDRRNPLAGNNGKPALAKNLGLAREIVMIGDGFTDYQVAEMSQADYFFGYAGVVRREKVLARADEVVESFDEITALLNLK